MKTPGTASPASPVPGSTPDHSPEQTASEERERERHQTTNARLARQAVIEVFSDKFELHVSHGEVGGFGFVTTPEKAGPAFSGGTPADDCFLGGTPADDVTAYVEGSANGTSKTTTPSPKTMDRGATTTIKTTINRIRRDQLYTKRNFVVESIGGSESCSPEKLGEALLMEPSSVIQLKNRTNNLRLNEASVVEKIDEDSPELCNAAAAVGAVERETPLTPPQTTIGTLVPGKDGVKQTLKCFLPDTHDEWFAILSVGLLRFWTNGARFWTRGSR